MGGLEGNVYLSSTWQYTENTEAFNQFNYSIVHLLGVVFLFSGTYSKECPVTSQHGK